MYSRLIVGFVVGVMEEGRRPYVVTIPPEETGGFGVGGGAGATVAAVPMDARIPKIRIKTRQLAQVRGNRLDLSPYRKALAPPGSWLA